MNSIRFVSYSVLFSRYFDHSLFLEDGEMIRYRFFGVTTLKRCVKTEFRDLYILLVLFFRSSGLNACYVFPEEVRDPCVGKICSFGARCIPSLDGHVARCVCPESCISYGDSVGSTPVCGTDGKDYVNECELQKAACRDMKDIAIKYIGKCDPCRGIVCPQQVCQLDSKRKPVCRCGLQCSAYDYDPVCASDNRTYSSECIMRKEACRSRSELNVLFRGHCSSLPEKNPCFRVRCSQFEVCRVVGLDNYAQCRCAGDEVLCEPILRQVCASDGRTYDNECEMMRKACVSKRTLVVQTMGPCPTDGPCKNFQCANNAYCVVKNKHPVCVCPICTEENHPVCGSNGITYSNECKLTSENCELRRNVMVKYYGECTTCENKKCDFHSSCREDGHGIAICICQSDCLQIIRPVCGTDGETYVNECEMNLSSCRKQVMIKVKSEGPCYNSDHNRPGVSCRVDANGVFTCSCDFNCIPATSKVCGSDGILYDSECSLRQEACIRKAELNVHQIDFCKVIAANSSSDKESSCKLSKYGCCHDELIAAPGPNNTGCPSFCSCNVLGSINKTCDPVSRQCACKLGVTGVRCDRCEPGYWGLQKMFDSSGCEPCNCHPVGAVRTDCEQSTGRCMCRKGIIGQKCSLCSNGMQLSASGGCGGDSIR